MYIFESKDLELTDKILMEIVECAKEVFGDFIFVPCNEHHCGYDILNFDEILEYDEILTYKFTNVDISNGIYYSHPYEGKTLKEILTLTNIQFEFEL